MKISTKWRWTLAIGAILLAFCFISPRDYFWVTAQFWYLRHRNGVPFLGKVIPVPRGMKGSVGKSFGQVSAHFIQYPPITHEASQFVPWSMDFYPNSIPHQKPKEAVSQLGKNMRREAARGGLLVGPAFVVDTQAGKGWCYTIEFDPGKNIQTDCLLFHAEWEAAYNGPPDHLKNFLKVVAGIHAAKK